MPIMKEDDVLRLEPGMTSALIDDAFADQDKEVEVVATADVTTPAGTVSWSKIKLLDDAIANEGWVRSAHVNLQGTPPGGGPIVKLTFARQCWVEALFSDANPHYIAAIAEMRSSTANDRQTMPQGSLIGPLRFTQEEWDAARAVADFGVTSYSARDIADWRMQVVVFTLMTHRTEQALTAELNAITAGRRPSAAELYLAQLIGVKAAVAAVTKTPSPTIKSAFDGVVAADQANDRPLGAPTLDKVVPRYAEFFGGGEVTGEQAIDRIVARLDPVLATTKDNIISAGRALVGAPVDNIAVGGGKSSVGEPSGLGGMGKTFAQKAPVIMRNLMHDIPQLQDFHVAGILGNIGRETGGFRLMQEVRPKKGLGGLGWLQWTGGRRTDFETFCNQQQLDPLSDQGNYAFMKHEMLGKENPAFNLFVATADIDRATFVFMDRYERPGVPALAERQDWARKALQAFQNPVPASSGLAATFGPVGTQLRARINAGQIIFDKPELEDELLGLTGNPRVTAKLQSLVLKLSDLTPLIRVSSLVRQGGGSFHALGRAVDIGNEDIAATLLPQVATAARVSELGIDELIFDARLINPGNDPNKFNFDQGAKHDFDQATINAHGNHIHFAVKL